MKNVWLTIDQPKTAYNVKLYSASHPCELYWGRDSKGRYLFVFIAKIGEAPKSEQLPKLRGITTSLNKTNSNENLILLLNEDKDWELFYSLCANLARATSSVKSSEEAGVIILNRLSRWQDLLKKERPNTLTRDQVKGLLGELIFLKDELVPNYGWEDSIGYWHGPNDAPQDFAVKDTSFEIKCKSGGTKPSVKISSAEQLESNLPKSYLVVYTLATASKDDGSSFTLNEYIERIRYELYSHSHSARDQFEDLVFMAGYKDSEEYERYRFSKIAIQTYAIEDDFPRICSSELKLGIDRVTYSLKLDACAPFTKSLGWRKSK